MSWPPMLMHIRVKNHNKSFGLWLPLFLLLPLALAVLIVFSPLILIGVIVLWPSGWGKWALLALWGATVSFWSLRGLKVDVQGPKDTVYVSVI